MIAPFLLTGSLLLTPVKDTVWWNTESGQVLGHRDNATATCTLWLFDKDGRIAFTWAKDQPLSVSAISPALTMPKDASRMSVSLQIGDGWLNDGKPYDAIGFGTSITFVVTQPIEDRLRSADHVTIFTPTSEFQMAISHSKISTLLDHVKQCVRG